MANNCFYKMKVQGSESNVNEFIKLIQVNYAYDDHNNCYNPSDNYKPVERHLWRVFNADVDEEYVGNKGKIAYISGDCAWSVYCCMCEGKHTYQFQYPNSKGTSLRQESERLQLTIEVFSEECGCCFMEHYVFQNGKCKVDSCVDWCEYCTLDYESVEEMNEDCGTNFTQEQFDAEEYISVGGLDWEFGKWQ